MKKQAFLFLMLLAIIPKVFAGEPDTTFKRLIVWNLAENYRSQKFTKVDTTIDQFQIYNPVFQNSYSNTYLGNLGTAHATNLFFEREKVSEFIFIDPYANYIHIPEKQLYYNTTTPFTHLMYTTSSGSKEHNEESLNIIHTQNVNRNLNVGLSYDRYPSKGHYVNQRSLTSAFSLFSNYTKKRYFFHFNANINKVKTQHNGGLYDVNGFITDTTGEDPANFAMRLNDASSVFKNKSIFLAHGYTIDLIKTKTQADTAIADSVIVEEAKLRGTLLHAFKFDMYQKYYKDIHELQSENDTLNDWYYYAPFYPMYSPETYDSVHYRTVTNYLQYDMEPGENSWIKSGLRVGIGNELEKYATYYLDTATVGEDLTYPLVKGHSLNTVNSYFASEIYNTSGQNWQWHVYGQYYFTGYKTNNIKLEGLLGKKFHFGSDSVLVLAKWTNNSEKPNYFYQHFYSNHLIWNNDFLNINETRISGSINLLSRELKLNANYALIDNYIYLDRTDSIFPSQYGDPLSILSFSLEKTFRFWKVTSVNKLVYQVVDNNDILSLPELSVYNSTYIRQNLVEEVLDAQLGFDIYYHTNYYADDFMASFGSFINQNEAKVGNYPFIDVYLSAKLKKVRFFLKFNHVNAGLFNRNYFTSYGYPMNNRFFKFGISTLFYN